MPDWNYVFSTERAGFGLVNWPAHAAAAIKPCNAGWDRGSILDAWPSGYLKQLPWSNWTTTYGLRFTPVSIGQPPRAQEAVHSDMNKKRHLSLLSLLLFDLRRLSSDALRDGGEPLEGISGSATSNWRLCFSAGSRLRVSGSRRWRAAIVASHIHCGASALGPAVFVRLSYCQGDCPNGVVTRRSRRLGVGARKARISAVSRMGVEFATTNGRVPNSLNELPLSNELKLDPWGFTLGYQKTTSGFRVFVRGAPDYVRALDISGKNLEKTVNVALRQHS